MSLLFLYVKVGSRFTRVGGFVICGHIATAAFGSGAGEASVTAARIATNSDVGKCVDRIVRSRLIAC